jgi:predicted nucleotidyltransferase
MATRSFQYPSVDQKLLAEVVRRICAIGNPQRIVLFGSRGRGDARPDSDIDLLIIEESDLPRYKRSARYRRALTGLFPAKDIVVWTPDEVRAWSAVKNAFVSVALREGRVLHER